MYHALIRDIVSENNELLSTGGHLSDLELEPDQWKELVSSISRGLDEDWYGLPPHEKLGWGAAMMLVGARVFGELPEGPFSWDKLGERIGIPQLSDEITTTEYSYIAEGSANHWNLEILENQRGHRRFIGTMLVHSGGGWAVVQSLIERVGTLWNWKGLTAASRVEITEWLQQIQQDYRYLPRSTRRVLETDDGRVGIAERLAQVARGRAKLRNQGLVAGNAQETLERVRHRGISISDLFGAPSERSDEDILNDIFNFMGRENQTELSSPQWQWLQPATRKPRLAISLPETIRNIAIDDGIDRIRVRLSNVEQNKSPIYRRKQGEEFKHFRGPKLLAVNKAASFPVQLVVEYRTDKETIVELPWHTVAFPGDPVGMFDHQTGEHIDEARAHRELLFVAPKNALLAGSAPLERIDCIGVEAWRATLPEEGLAYEVLRPEADEVIEELVRPKSKTLQLRVAGNRINGLKFGNAPAYKDWPEILVGSDITDAHYELRCGSSRQDTQRGTCTVRGGRLVLQDLKRRPGRYTLHVEAGNRSSRVRFAVLPPGTKFHVEHSTSGTKLEVHHLDADLSHSDAAETTAHNALQFPEDIRKTLAVSVDAHRRAPSLRNGRWRVTAAPYRAEVVGERDGDVIDQPRNLSILRGNGGLQLYGPPSAPVRIETGTYRWSLRLDGRGRRFFPFTNLPEAAFHIERQPFEISVRWDGAETAFGPFIDQRLMEPQADAWQPLGQEVFNVRCELLWDVGGELEMELLPAWSPWSKPKKAVAQRVEDEAEGCRYGAQFRVAPGPYKVRLIRGDIPMCGVADVVLQTSQTNRIKPENQLDPYQWYLWRVHAGSTHAHPDLALEAFEECEPTVRNRRRTQLLRQLEHWSPRWFASRLLLPEIATEENLRAKLNLPVPHLSEKKVPDAFSHISSLAVRHIDLEHAGELVSRRAPDEQADIILHLTELQAGLLVPAFRAWRNGLSDAVMERIAPELRPWKTANSDSVDTLSREEYDKLRVLDEASRRDNHPRLRGLWEARNYEDQLSEDSDIDDAVRAVKQYIREHDVQLPGSVRRAVQNETFRLTAEIEAAVAAICHELHHWREGNHRDPMPWDTLETLHRCVPGLIDYWLNRYALGISVSQEVA